MTKLIAISSLLLTLAGIGCTANVDDPTVDQSGSTADKDTVVIECTKDCDATKTECSGSCDGDSCQGSCTTDHDECVTDCDEEEE